MLLLVQNCSIWFQNNTKYENDQNSQKQSWENNLIFKYIRIFWTNIFIHKNICRFFMAEFIWIFMRGIFIMPIYSDIHSSNIYGNEYIRILIRPKI